MDGKSPLYLIFSIPKEEPIEKYSFLLITGNTSFHVFSTISLGSKNLGNNKEYSLYFIVFDLERLKIQPGKYRINYTFNQKTYISNHFFINQQKSKYLFDITFFEDKNKQLNPILTLTEIVQLYLNYNEKKYLNNYNDKFVTTFIEDFEETIITNQNILQNNEIEALLIIILKFPTKKKLLKRIISQIDINRLSNNFILNPLQYRQSFDEFLNVCSQEESLHPRSLTVSNKFNNNEQNFFEQSNKLLLYVYKNYFPQELVHCIESADDLKKKSLLTILFGEQYYQIFKGLDENIVCDLLKFCKNIYQVQNCLNKVKDLQALFNVLQKTIDDLKQTYSSSKNKIQINKINWLIDLNTERNLENMNNSNSYYLIELYNKILSFLEENKVSFIEITENFWINYVNSLNDSHEIFMFIIEHYNFISTLKIIIDIEIKHAKMNNKNSSFLDIVKLCQKIEELQGLNKITNVKIKPNFWLGILHLLIDQVKIKESYQFIEFLKCQYTSIYKIIKNDIDQAIHDKCITFFNKNQIFNEDALYVILMNIEFFKENQSKCLNKLVNLLNFDTINQKEFITLFKKIKFHKETFPNSMDKFYEQIIPKLNNMHQYETLMQMIGGDVAYEKIILSLQKKFLSEISKNKDYNSVYHCCCWFLYYFSYDIHLCLNFLKKFESVYKFNKKYLSIVCVQILLAFSNYSFIFQHLIEFLDNNYVDVDNYYLINEYITVIEKSMLTSNLINLIGYIESNSIKKHDIFNMNKTTNYLLYIDLFVNDRFNKYDDIKVYQVFKKSPYYLNCKTTLMEITNRIVNFRLSNEEKELLHSFSKDELNNRFKYFLKEKEILKLNEQLNKYIKEKDINTNITKFLNFYYFTETERNLMKLNYTIEQLNNFATKYNNLINLIIFKRIFFDFKRQEIKFNVNDSIISAAYNKYTALRINDILKKNNDFFYKIFFYIDVQELHEELLNNQNFVSTLNSSPILKDKLSVMIEKNSIYALVNAIIWLIQIFEIKRTDFYIKLNDINTKLPEVDSMEIINEIKKQLLQLNIDSKGNKYNLIKKVFFNNSMIDIINYVRKNVKIESMSFLLKEPSVYNLKFSTWFDFIEIINVLNSNVQFKQNNLKIEDSVFFEQLTKVYDSNNVQLNESYDNVISNLSSIENAVNLLFNVDRDIYIINKMQLLLQKSRFIIKYEYNNNNTGVIVNVEYNNDTKIAFTKVISLKNQASLLLQNKNLSTYHNILNDFINLILKIERVIKCMETIYLFGDFHNKSITIEIINSSYVNNAYQNDIDLLINELTDYHSNLIDEMITQFKNNIIFTFVPSNFIPICTQILSTKQKYNPIFNSFLSYITCNRTDYETFQINYDKQVFDTKITQNNIEQLNNDIKMEWLASWINNIISKQINYDIINEIKVNSCIQNDKISGEIYEYVNNKKDGLIDSMFYIWMYLTNKQPHVHNILLCNENTTEQEIIAFSFRALSFPYKALFTLILTENTKENIIKKINALVNQVGEVFTGTQKSVYIIISNKTIRNEDSIIQECPFENIDLLLSEEQKEYKYSNTELVVSEKPGLGKTFYIKHSISKTKVITLTINPLFNKENNNIYLNIPNLINYFDEEFTSQNKKFPNSKTPTTIHINLILKKHPISNSILNTLLLSLIHFRSFSSGNNFFIIDKSSSIMLEISTPYDYDINEFPFLQHIQNVYKITSETPFAFKCNEKINRYANIVYEFLTPVNQEKKKSRGSLIQEVIILKQFNCYLYNINMNLFGELIKQGTSNSSQIYPDLMLIQSNKDQAMNIILKGQNKEFQNRASMFINEVPKSKNNIEEIIPYNINQLVKDDNLLFNEIQSKDFIKNFNTTLMITMNDSNNIFDIFYCKIYNLKIIHLNLSAGNHLVTLIPCYKIISIIAKSKSIKSLFLNVTNEMTLADIENYFTENHLYENNIQTNEIYLYVKGFNINANVIMLFEDIIIRGELNYKKVKSNILYILEMDTTCNKNPIPNCLADYAVHLLNYKENELISIFRSYINEMIINRNILNVFTKEEKRNFADEVWKFVCKFISILKKYSDINIENCFNEGNRCHFVKLLIYYYRYFQRINNCNSSVQDETQLFTNFQQALNMTLFICFYCQMTSSNIKEEEVIQMYNSLEHCESTSKWFQGNFMKVPNNEIKKFQSEVKIKDKKDAKLLYLIYICISNQINIYINGPINNKKYIYDVLLKTNLFTYISNNPQLSSIYYDDTIVLSTPENARIALNQIINKSENIDSSPIIYNFGKINSLRILNEIDRELMLNSNKLMFIGNINIKNVAIKIQHALIINSEGLEIEENITEEILVTYALKEAEKIYGSFEKDFSEALKSYAKILIECVKNKEKFWKIANVENFVSFVLDVLDVYYNIKNKIQLSEDEIEEIFNKHFSIVNKAKKTQNINNIITHLSHPSSRAFAIITSNSFIPYIITTFISLLNKQEQELNLSSSTIYQSQHIYMSTFAKDTSSYSEYLSNIISSISTYLQQKHNIIFINNASCSIYSAFRDYFTSKQNNYILYDIYNSMNSKFDLSSKLIFFINENENFDNYYMNNISLYKITFDDIVNNDINKEINELCSKTAVTLFNSLNTENDIFTDKHFLFETNDEIKYMFYIHKIQTQNEMLLKIKETVGLLSTPEYIISLQNNNAMHLLRDNIYTYFNEKVITFDSFITQYKKCIIYTYTNYYYQINNKDDYIHLLINERCVYKQLQNDIEEKLKVEGVKKILLHFEYEAVLNNDALNFVMYIIKEIESHIENKVDFVFIIYIPSRDCNIFINKIPLTVTDYHQVFISDITITANDINDIQRIYSFIKKTNSDLLLVKDFVDINERYNNELTLFFHNKEDIQNIVNSSQYKQLFIDFIINNSNSKNSEPFLYGALKKCNNDIINNNIQNNQTLFNILKEQFIIKVNNNLKEEFQKFINDGLFNPLLNDGGNNKELLQFYFTKRLNYNNNYYLSLHHNKKLTQIPQNKVIGSFYYFRCLFNRFDSLFTVEGNKKYCLYEIYNKEINTFLQDSEIKEQDLIDDLYLYIMTTELEINNENILEMIKFIIESMITNFDIQFNDNDINDIEDDDLSFNDISKKMFVIQKYKKALITLFDFYKYIVPFMSEFNINQIEIANIKSLDDIILTSFTCLLSSLFSTEINDNNETIYVKCLTDIATNLQHNITTDSILSKSSLLIHLTMLTSFKVTSHITQYHKILNDNIIKLIKNTVMFSKHINLLLEIYSNDISYIFDYIQSQFKTFEENQTNIITLITAEPKLLINSFLMFDVLFKVNINKLPTSSSQLELALLQETPVQYKKVLHCMIIYYFEYQLHLKGELDNEVFEECMDIIKEGNTKEIDNTPMLYSIAYVKFFLLHYIQKLLQKDNKQHIDNDITKIINNCKCNEIYLYIMRLFMKDNVSFAKFLKTDFSKYDFTWQTDIFSEMNEMEFHCDLKHLFLEKQILQPSKLYEQFCTYNSDQNYDINELNETLLPLIQSNYLELVNVFTNIFFCYFITNKNYPPNSTKKKNLFRLAKQLIELHNILRDYPKADKLMKMLLNYTALDLGKDNVSFQYKDIEKLSKEMRYVLLLCIKLAFLCEFSNNNSFIKKVFNDTELIKKKFLITTHKENQPKTIENCFLELIFYSYLYCQYVSSSIPQHLFEIVLISKENCLSLIENTFHSITSLLSKKSYIIASNPLEYTVIYLQMILTNNFLHILDVSNNIEDIKNNINSLCNYIADQFENITNNYIIYNNDLLVDKYSLENIQLLIFDLPQSCTVFNTQKEGEMVNKFINEYMYSTFPYFVKYEDIKETFMFNNMYKEKYKLLWYIIVNDSKIEMLSKINGILNFINIITKYLSHRITRSKAKVTNIKEEIESLINVNENKDIQKYYQYFIYNINGILNTICNINDWENTMIYEWLPFIYENNESNIIKKILDYAICIHNEIVSTLTDNKEKYGYILEDKCICIDNVKETIAKLVLYWNSIYNIDNNDKTEQVDLLSCKKQIIQINFSLIQNDFIKKYLPDIYTLNTNIYSNNNNEFIFAYEMFPYISNNYNLFSSYLCSISQDQSDQNKINKIVQSSYRNENLSFKREILFSLNKLVYFLIKNNIYLSHKNIPLISILNLLNDDNMDIQLFLSENEDTFTYENVIYLLHEIEEMYFEDIDEELNNIYKYDVSQNKVDNILNELNKGKLKIITQNVFVKGLKRFVVRELCGEKKVNEEEDVLNIIKGKTEMYLMQTLTKEVEEELMKCEEVFTKEKGIKVKEVFCFCKLCDDIIGDNKMEGNNSKNSKDDGINKLGKTSIQKHNRAQMIVQDPFQIQNNSFLPGRPSIPNFNLQTQQKQRNNYGMY